MSKLISHFRVWLTWLWKTPNLVIQYVIEKVRQTIRWSPFCGYINAEVGIVPKSVNYHFTRACNYRCGFCFHTSTTSYVLKIEDAMRGLELMKNAGMQKINFSGGEPFIHQRGRFVGELVKYCKSSLNLESVSIVSNGSLITKKWMINYGAHLDILAISCDSFDAAVNNKIGRFQNINTDHIGKMYKIREWCREFGIIFKINTVVNTYNIDEDMTVPIKTLNPVRWKVFQCLLINDENVGPQALRDARPFYITDEDFAKFIERHSDIKCMIPESNALMKDSYLLLDEYMRFLNCRSNAKEPSKSILDVGVENALKFAGFDETAFLERGGFYKWSRKQSGPNLEW